MKVRNGHGKGAALLAALVLALCTSTLRAAVKGPWLVEMRSFDAFQSRQAHIGKAVGNAMLPMMLVSFAQQRIVKMFGKMRAADPVRWVGYPAGKGSVDVVMVYPTVDKVAKMVLNHPGAEKVADDMVLLPEDEGRQMETYAAFSTNFDFCAFARTPELAKRALGERFPVAGGDLFAISADGASGAFDFDEKGFKFTARTVTPETAEKLKDIPFLGSLAKGGATRYITFADIKALVTELVTEMMPASDATK